MADVSTIITVMLVATVANSLVANKLSTESGASDEAVLQVELSLDDHSVVQPNSSPKNRVGLHFVTRDNISLVMECINAMNSAKKRELFSSQEQKVLLSCQTKNSFAHLRSRRGAPDSAESASSNGTDSEWKSRDETDREPQINNAKRVEADEPTHSIPESPNTPSTFKAPSSLHPPRRPQGPPVAPSTLQHTRLAAARSAAPGDLNVDNNGNNEAATFVGGAAEASRNSPVVLPLAPRLRQSSSTSESTVYAREHGGHSHGYKAQSYHKGPSYYPAPYKGPAYSPYDFQPKGYAKFNKKVKYGDDPVKESQKAKYHVGYEDQPQSYFGGFGGGGTVGYSGGGGYGGGHGGGGHGGGGHGGGHGGSGYGSGHDSGGYGSNHNSGGDHGSGGGSYGGDHGGGHGGGSSYGGDHGGGGGDHGGGYGKVNPEQSAQYYTSDYKAANTDYKAASSDYKTPTYGYTENSPAYGQNIPAPDSNAPSPTYDTFAQFHGTQTQSYEAAAPTYAGQTTSYEAPTPSYEELKPGYETPTSSYNAQNSKYEAPNANYETPNPSYIAPAINYKGYLSPPTEFKPSGPQIQYEILDDPFNTYNTKTDASLLKGSSYNRRTSEAARYTNLPRESSDNVGDFGKTEATLAFDVPATYPTDQRTTGPTPFGNLFAGFDEVFEDRLRSDTPQGTS
nr:interleukin enhancer-binding factor 3-like [Procambarus clarkii]